MVDLLLIRTFTAPDLGVTDLRSTVTILLHHHLRDRIQFPTTPLDHSTNKDRIITTLLTTVLTYSTRHREVGLLRM
jgi:hypothetical protein